MSRLAIQEQIMCRLNEKVRARTTYAERSQYIGTMFRFEMTAIRNRLLKST